jgi:hypothetical protein
VSLECGVTNRSERKGYSRGKRSNLDDSIDAPSKGATIRIRVWIPIAVASYTVHAPADGGFGNLKPDGSASGLIGMCQR